VAANIVSTAIVPLSAFQRIMPPLSSEPPGEAPNDTAFSIVALETRAIISGTSDFRRHQPAIGVPLPVAPSAKQRSTVS
jgi:hypothetical protein